MSERDKCNKGSLNDMARSVDDLHRKRINVRKVNKNPELENSEKKNNKKVMKITKVFLASKTHYNKMSVNVFKNDSMNSDRDTNNSSKTTSSDDKFRASSKKNLCFNNKLVTLLYKSFNGKCSMEQALNFFKSKEVSASNFDADFWSEILYCIDLSSSKIKNVLDFKKNILNLIKEKEASEGKGKDYFSNILFAFFSSNDNQEPKKIKFSISSDMFQRLVYNDSQVKGFLDYLDCGERQKYLDSFRIILDGSNDNMRRESCGKLLNFILEDLEDNRQPIKNMIDLLQICRILLDRKTIPVNVDGWKKIFSKINRLSIKDFLNISSILDYPTIELDDLKRFLFRKLNSKDDTQDEVKQFIDVFFPNDKIKNEIKNDELNNRLYVFNLSVGSFPDKKLDFSLVTSFAKNNFGLELSNLNIESLIELISKVKSDSIDSKVFQSLVETVKGKKILLGTKNNVDKLRQLLCGVLRISKKELGFSNVMDLFLLYPKMPEFCTKSTLTNESLELALEKISAIVSSNENLGGDKDKFRNKFKKFIELFEDNSNKITFSNFKNLVLAVPDDFLDFDSVNYLLEKTDTKEHQNDLCSFFESTLLKKISQYKFDLAHVHDFFYKYLSSKSVKNYKFKAETFKFIVDNTINSNQDRSCNNNDIKWLLQKCCDAGLKLEKDKFVNLIKKGKTEKISDDVAKIDWMKMNDFINKIVSPKSGFLDKGKIEFDKNELDCILSRTKFCFDESKLGDFLEKILTLKRFVTSDKLFAIVLNRIPLNGLPSLDVFRKVVYYCFEDVENYNSDRQIPVDYRHKIDFKLYNELLKTFQDNSLSYDDFKMLNSNFFNEQRSDSLLNLLFGLFNENKTNANVSNIDHTVLRKKLKKGILSSNQIQELFKKFEKKISIDQFVELLMLAKDESLTEDDVISLFNNYCNEEMPLEANKYKKKSSIKDEKSLLEKAEINTKSIDETHNKNEIINIDDNIPSFSNVKNESLISHRTSANPKATVPVDLVKSINIEQKNYFDMVTRKINGMKNVQELKKRLQKSNTEKRWMKLLDDIDDDFSLLFRLNSEMLANKYQLFVEKYQKHKKDNSNNSNVDSKHLSIKTDVNGNTNNLDFNLNGVVNNEREDYMDYEKFKADFFMLWGRLDKKRQRYIQVIFGHKTRLWPTAVCWCFSYMFFYPGILVCYLLGVAMILFFTFKFIDKMVRRGLVGVAHGEKPFFLISGNKCIKAALLCKNLEQTYSASKIEEKSLLYSINQAKDKILSVMVPNMESGKLGSFMEELSSLKNGAIHVFDLVKNRVF